MSFANPTSASRGCDYVFCSTKEYSVILGTSKLKPLQAALIPVKDIIMHPKFWGRTFIMGDVALLHLHSPATFTKYVQPICLPEPSYDLKVGTQCWVTGWGQVKQRFSGERAGCRGGCGTREGAPPYFWGLAGWTPSWCLSGSLWLLPPGPGSLVGLGLSADGDHFQGLHHSACWGHLTQV